MARTDASTAQSTQVDALTLLTTDHDLVEALFHDYETLIGSEAEDDLRQALAEQICLELSVHTQIEEEIFYPAVRDALEDEHLVDEAEEEHDQAKELIAQIEEMDADEEDYDARVTVLREAVQRHVEEEQNEMFPKVRKSGIDLSTLGAELAARRDELRAEVGLSDDDAKPQDSDDD